MIDFLQAQRERDTFLEQSVLGAILFAPETFEDVADIFHADYFTTPIHKLIARSILKAWQSGRLPDLVEITEIVMNVYPDQAGYVADLVSSVATTVNLRFHVQALSKRAVQRAMLNKLQSFQQELSGPIEPNELEELIFKEISELSEIYEQQANFATVRSAKEVAVSFYEDFLNERGSGWRGLPTGIADVDAITSGLADSEYIIIAARPSVGKTALSLQIALNVALKQQKPTAFFSLEMSEKSLVARILANLARINSELITTKLIKPNSHEDAALSIALGQLEKSQLFIDDTPAISLTQIKAKARQIQKRHGLSLIIVDYLSLVHTGERHVNNTERTEYISRGLKAIAKELNVPLICLCQLNRASMDKTRPEMHHLRDSGAIEQDADIIMLLHREDYYNPNVEEKNILEINIAKNRNGRTGMAKVFYDRETQRIFDLTRR